MLDERNFEESNTTTPARKGLPASRLERHATSEYSNLRQQVRLVRLPKINLPRFNGDITRFQAFWQSLKCSVDQNEYLSDAHKLNYLMSVLEGPANIARFRNKGGGLCTCNENDKGTIWESTNNYRYINEGTCEYRRTGKHENK